MLHLLQRINLLRKALHFEIKFNQINFRNKEKGIRVLCQNNVNSVTIVYCQWIITIRDRAPIVLYCTLHLYIQWNMITAAITVWLHCLHPSSFHCVSRITWSEVLLKPFNINLNRFYRFKSNAMWQSDMISKRAFAVLCWDCLSKGEREKDCI